MRLHNHLELLTEAVTEFANQPFEWGVNDCCLFAANCVRAQTGEDYYEQFRNRYTSAIGAAKVMKKDGFESVEAIATNFLGDPMENHLYAKRGDVVMTTTNEGPALGIMFGGGGLFVTPLGLVRVPITELLKAWSV